MKERQKITSFWTYMMAQMNRPIQAPSIDETQINITDLLGWLELLLYCVLESGL
jgi:hypothetical protein